MLDRHKIIKSFHTIVLQMSIRNKIHIILSLEILCSRSL